MQEKYSEFTKLYDARFIIKFEKLVDTYIETYIEVKDGVVYKRKYINNILADEKILEDMN